MKELLRERQIDTLYHFTRAENLANIFRFGLVPRKYLDENFISSKYNDIYRYDECPDAVCTSIEFPNYLMFYKYRMEDLGVDWAVLKLDARIMCDYKCAYCWANAGSALMYNIPLKDRMGKKAFLGLFGDWPGYPKRETLNIGDWYPTNPQAEVLVFNTIPVAYIQQVLFQDRAVRDKYANVVPNYVDVGINSKVFSYRNDWEHWKRSI